MSTMETSADAESVAAVVRFRESVGKLKSITGDIPTIEDVIKSTDEVFVQCDDALKHIYGQNDQGEEVRNKLLSINRSVEKHEREVCRIDESLQVLATAERYMKLMKQIESHFAEKDFYRLVVKVEQLRLELGEYPFRGAKVFTGILKQVEKWRAISSDWLGACVDQCITVALNENSISCSVDQKYLKNLCKEASYDLLLNVFDLFSGQLLSNVLVPILRRSVVSMSTNTDVLVVNLEQEDLTDSPDRFDSGDESATLTVIPSIISVFRFVKEHIFVYLKSRKFYHDIVARFGSHIVNDMSSLLCSIFLRPLLPNKPSKLGSFHHLISHINELQSYLEETGFQPEPNKVLVEFVESHVNIVLEKYEAALLVKARDIMLLDWEDLAPLPSEAHSNPMKVTSVKLPSRFQSDSVTESLFGSSSQSLFTLPGCQVSSLLVKFMELVRELLDEVKTLGKNSSDSSNERENAWLAGVLRFMAPCARHVADLFLTFLPVGTVSLKCGSLMSAAIILCNCAYFANSLLLLEVEFASIKMNLSVCRNALPTFIFLDMVQPARSHGWTVFRKALEQARSQLLDVDLEPWSQGASGKLMASGFRSRCEQSLAVVVSKLAHVISTLRTVLPVTLASSVLGLLMDAVLSTMVSQLASRVDISDAESRVHFEMLTHFSEELIEKVGIVAASDAGKNQSASSVTGKVYLTKLCPESWPRFLDMVSLLDSDLVTIVNRWADGAGPLATSFAADELRMIIRALFQNSEVRQRALNSIK